MSRTRIIGALSAIAVIALAGCAKKDAHGDWSYEGSTGPAHWGDLSPDYELAKTGREQSPIDISGPAAADLPAIEFSYQAAPVNVINNGHTIEQKMADGSSITVGGDTYALKQFHFHSPSEHTIDGDHAAMEMHLVHANASGALAVVGVMIVEGEHNAAFAPVWGAMPATKGGTSNSTASVNPMDLLPSSKDYYAYKGSLTTPPCSEGVRWMVLESPVQLSAAQIDAFRAIIYGNNRPTQPLNARTVSSSN